MNILDIHSHNLCNKRVDTIYNLIYPNFSLDNLSYSLGIHPWYIPKDINWTDFIDKASNNNILAIGEVGIDKLQSNSSLERQIEVFRKQVEIAESVAKPVIIHMVKSIDYILSIKRKINPQQPWIIHGFRGKPEQANLLNKHNIYFSIGEKYNLDSIDINRLLVETDESTIAIEDVIKRVAKDFNLREQELINTIKKNVNTIFF